MEPKRCFEPNCEFEVEYECPCTSPLISSCEFHLGKHLKLPNRAHNYEFIFIESHEGTREAILEFLKNEKSKHNKLKRNIAASFSQRLSDSEHDIKELINNLDSHSSEVRNCFTKISETKKISKSEKDPILGLLSLQPDEALEKVKMLIPANPDWYNNAKVFCGFSEKIEKLINCFIKDKFESYLDKRLFGIEKTLEEHDKIINLQNENNNQAIISINNQLENVKESVSKLIDENKKSQKEIEDWKEEIKIKTENEINLLDSKIIRIAEDLKGKIKKAAKVKNKNSENKMQILQELREKTFEIWNGQNSLEIEQDFRKTCSIYEYDARIYKSPLKQAYQDYTNAYHQNSSLFIINKDMSNNTNLFVYDTEGNTQEVKVLETPEVLSVYTCIAQLPKGKLFCFGNSSISGISLIIDRNYRVRQLPSGTPCRDSSAIYFDKNVYCFGGNNNSVLTLSERFDLNANRWIKLTPMPHPDFYCSSIIFNENILIAGYSNRNILRYSIDSNTFVKISFQFAENKRKILINAERLYLIECFYGSIYESDISNDSAWRKIGNSIINEDPYQSYCSYNRGATNIACCDGATISYYKFDLSQKSLTALL